MSFVSLSQVPMQGIAKGLLLMSISESQLQL